VKGKIPRQPTHAVSNPPTNGPSESQPEVHAGHGDPQRAAEPRPRVDGGEDRGAGSEDERAARTLQQPKSDQHLRGGSDRTEEGGYGEHDQPGDEDESSPDDVGEGPERQPQGGRRQEEGAGDPTEPDRTQAELRRDGRERNGHRRPGSARVVAFAGYQGRFDGLAARVPVPVGSIADIVALVARSTSVDEVNRIFREETRADRYRDIVGVSEEAIVSTDIIRDSRASVVDCTLTQVVDGDLVEVMSRYDNEWCYAAQLLREAKALDRGMK